MPPAPLVALLALCLLQAPAQRPARRPLARHVVMPRLVRLPPREGESRGRLDLETNLKLLERMHAKALLFEIGNRRSDWDEFRDLLSATKKTGLQIWAGIRPPTLGGNSQPYLGAFERWAEECARLGRTNKHFTALVIREVGYSRNPKYLHPGRLGRMHEALAKAGMSLLGGFYDLTKRAAATYADCLDGALLHFTSTRSYRNLAAFVDGARALVPKRWSLHVLLDCAPDPLLGEVDVPPAPVVLHYQMRVADRLGDGFVLRNLDLTRPAKILPGPEGFSQLLVTAGQYIRDRDAGRPLKVPH